VVEVELSDKEMMAVTDKMLLVVKQAVVVEELVRLVQMV
jgi:hypothetical protein